MIKTLNRPRMISSVPLELKSQTNFVEGKNLTPTAMPSTAYITKVSRQSSILDLSITIQNTSKDTPIEIKIIEILLPVGQNSNANNLTTTAALSAIISGAEGNLWNVNSGAISGQFLATPKTGDSNTFSPGDIAVFYLDAIALNTTVGISSISIKVKDTSDTITNLTTTVTKEIAKSQITQFVSQDSIILPGATTSLIWDTNEIDYCLISPGYDNKKHPLDANGNLKIQPNQDTTYTLWAYGVGIILSSQRTVTINKPKPEIVNFSLLWKNNKLMATWETKNTTKATLQPVPNLLNPNGKIELYPGYSLQTSYTLIAKNDSGDEVTKVLKATYDSLYKDTRSPIKIQNAKYVATSPDAETIYVVSGKQNLSVLDSKTLIEIPSSPINIVNGTGISRYVSVSKKDNRIYATIYLETGTKLVILDPTTLQQIPGSPFTIDNLNSPIVISPDFKRIYSTKERFETVPGGVKALDYDTLQEIAGSPIISENGFQSIAVSHDSTRLFLLKKDRRSKSNNSVTVFDAKTLSPISEPSIKADEYSSCIAVSPDGRRLYISNLNNYLTILDAQTFQEIPESPIKMGRSPNFITFSPDGDFVFIKNSYDNTVVILNTQTLEPTKASPISIYGDISTITISSNGIFYASEHQNGLCILMSNFTEVTE